MGDMDFNNKIYTVADRLLLAGVKPTAGLIAESLGASVDEVEGSLHGWWSLIPERLAMSTAAVAVPDVPEALKESFARIWQQAVQEANSQAVTEQHYQEVGLDEARREADESLHATRERLLDLEEKLREQALKKEDVEAQIKGLEAEIEVLKNNLLTETSQRKQEEQQRQNVEQELTLLRKKFDDSKRTFDQRIKDEQRHALEAVSKSEADVRYYRNALEKLRDEIGKKESALTKSIHDLQAELARKEVKSDTQKGQIKGLEEELKKVKQDTSGQYRDIAKANSQLLSETNKNKRLEDKIKELEEEIKKARQKQVVQANEQARRESAIRSQYKSKEEELVRALAKVSALEKKAFVQDKEIRRLNSRL